LAITPSRPCCRAASSRASPSSKTPDRRTVGERPLEHRLPVHLEHVEDVVDEPAPALLHEREARPALVVDRADLAVEHAARCPQRAGKRSRDRREPLGQVVVAAAAELDRGVPDVGEGAVSVPLRLEQPVGSARQSVGQRGEHRVVAAARRALSALRRRAPLLPLPEDQPVLLVSGEMRRHERPEPLEPLAVETDGQPAVSLLLDELVRARVPDLDGAGAVLSLRDLALESRVLERVVLDVYGEVLRPRLRRHPLRHRPAREHAVALETEVVVEPPCIVPLDDEDRRLPPRAAPAVGERLGRRLRIALGPVGTELRFLLHRFSSTFPQARIPACAKRHAVTARHRLLNACETVGRQFRPSWAANRLSMRIPTIPGDGDKPVEPVD
jgi:hypothetical protein